MKKNICLITLAVLAAFSTLDIQAREHHSDRHIEYVGGGRSVCSGSDCGDFNARNARRDRQAEEARQRDENERYERRRQQDQQHERERRRDRDRD